MIEVLKQAIEALEYFDERAATINEIQMARPVLLHLRQAIRELESQEPVAILNHAHGVHTFRNVNLKGLPDGEYLVYTHPPQRTWVGLTEEDYVLVNQLCINPTQAAEFVDRLLKEKNT